MRHFVIEHEKNPIAVVFHDYRDRTFLCRSNSESFLRAFNAICVKSEISFEQDSGILRAVSTGPEDYDWITFALDQLDKDYWSVSDKGDIRPLESNIDEEIARYLA